MPDAPAEILYGYVTAKFTKLVQDTSDVGDQPELENLSGKVRIAADLPGNWFRITLPDNRSLSTLQNEEYPIINGKTAGHGPGGTISLVASADNPYINPAPFQYTATFVIDGMTVQPPPIRFSLHPGETVELTDIISMPPVAPVLTVVSQDAAIRAETAAAEAEALLSGGIGAAVEEYLSENPPTGGSGPDAYSDISSLPGYPTTFPPAIGSTATTAVAGNDARLTDTRVPTDSSVTNAKVASNAAISLDKTADGTRLAMTSAERTKLAGVAAGSTANATNAELRDRATHTGTQTSASISDLTEAVQDIVGAFFGAGTGATVTYNDAANTITVSATGSTDPEVIRDTLGVALVGVGNITVTVNDASDTITISSTATTNSTDAQLRDRSTHTGFQTASTISDFATAVAVLMANAPYDIEVTSTGMARPVTNRPVYWKGGTTKPTNFADGDVWLKDAV